MGLYNPDLDIIPIPKNEEEIAGNPGFWLAAVRLMQDNITQGRHQFQVMHDQISTWENNNARLKIEIADIQDENNNLMAKNTKANLLIANLQSQLTLANLSGSKLSSRRKPNQVSSFRPTVSTPASSASTGNSASSGGKDKDSSVGRTKGLLNPAKEARQINSHLCICCGDAKHDTAECPDFLEIRQILHPHLPFKLSNRRKTWSLYKTTPTTT